MLLRCALGVLLAVAYAALLSSWLWGPPPAHLSLLLALAIATVITVGSFFLNLQLFVPVVRAGDPATGALALTFDDGPHPAHTREVLRLLAERGHRATFFVVGGRVLEHPQVVREIVAQGHELGLHSHTHDYGLVFWSPERIARDLEQNISAIEEVTGQRPSIFRPPVGITSPRLALAVRALGLRVIGWSGRAYDGIGDPPPERILARLRDRLRAGAIILLHDRRERGEERPTSIDALPALLDEIERRGLRSVPVSELCPHAPASVPDAGAAFAGSPMP